MQSILFYTEYLIFHFNYFYKGYLSVKLEEIAFFFIGCYLLYSNNSKCTINKNSIKTVAFTHWSCPEPFNSSHVFHFFAQLSSTLFFCGVKPSNSRTGYPVRSVRDG
jgi:hypothetical protein